MRTYLIIFVVSTNSPLLSQISSYITSTIRLAAQGHATKGHACGAKRTREAINQGDRKLSCSSEPGYGFSRKGVRDEATESFLSRRSVQHMEEEYGNVGRGNQEGQIVFILSLETLE